MPFRWKYILLPLIILLLSIFLTLFYYRLLPAEVAYHFEDGTPDQWLGRGAIIAWMLVPQLFFVLVAAGIVGGVIWWSRRSREANNVVMAKMLSIMGNMMALPQVILSFAMLDIFSYNAYQTHIMPLWIFAVIVMVLGGITLGVFFFSVARRVWRSSG